MQATVSAFDATTREGAVLLDDGRRLPFDGAAVAAGVRLLRPGQRVRIELGADEVRPVATIALPGLD